MRRALGVLAVCAAALVPAVALAAPAVATSAVLSDVSIVNDNSGFAVTYHGIGNLITLTTSASHMYQADCHNVNWLNQGPVPVCEWGNASGLCLGVDSNGHSQAQACDGGTGQLWWTRRDTSDGSQAYWLINDHWSGVAGQNSFATADTPQNGSLIDQFTAGSGLAAVWLIG